MLLLIPIKILVVIGLVQFQMMSGRAILSTLLWTALHVIFYVFGGEPLWLLILEVGAGALFFGFLQRYQHDWRWYPTLFIGAPVIVVL